MRILVQETEERWSKPAGPTFVKVDGTVSTVLINVKTTYFGS
jgi:hypothetical protein